MHHADPSASRALAAFAAEFEWADIPPAVRREACRSLLNFFAASLAGCRTPAIGIMLGALREFSGPPAARIIGRAERADILTAACVNAASANVLDFDDTHPGTIIHPTAPVAPALWALAESSPVSGRDLLTAFILGAEIECRIGLAMSPGHYRRGWHITATCGTFGAACGAGRLLGLRAPAMLDALGAASAQASGLVETLGTMAKSIGVGQAARGGLLAALLAGRGFTGPARPLDGERGYLNVACDAPDAGALTDGLGSRWEIARNTYKPYPCGVVLNPVIEACLALRGTPGFGSAPIAAIRVSGHPLLRERTDRPDIATGNQSQVSAQHAVAVTLREGAPGPEQFSDASVADAATAALRRKVTVLERADLPVGAAIVTVETEDGRVFEHAVADARGDGGNPLTDADLRAKLGAQIPRSGATLDPDAFSAAVLSLADRDPAGPLLDMIRPAPAPAPTG